MARKEGVIMATIHGGDCGTGCDECAILCALRGHAGCETPRTVAAEVPVDSGTWPVAVLVQGDDIEHSDCDTCNRPARQWPHLGYGRPGSMYRAALYCSDCEPYAVDPSTGAVVESLTGV